MNIIETPVRVAASDWSEESRPRSSGLHLSQIIQSLEASVDPGKYKNQFTEQQRQHYMATGFLWENLLSLAYAETMIRQSKGQLIRPGEVLLDGIAMSPDGWDIKENRLHEYKATWKSAGRLPPVGSSASEIVAAFEKDFWNYLIQIQGYCRGLGCRVASIWILFVCGDWKPPAPCSRRFDFEFTDKELKENWLMCTNEAKSKGWL